MKIAITGANGFIGRNLAELLLSQGHQLTLITREQKERGHGIPTMSTSEQTMDAKARLLPIGLENEDAMTIALAGCEVVVHCAGINREIGRQTYQHVHIDGTRHLVNAARKA